MKTSILNNLTRSLFVALALGLSGFVMAKTPELESETAESYANFFGDYEICGSCINGVQFCRYFFNNRVVFRGYVPCYPELGSVLNLKTNQYQIEAYPPIWDRDETHS